MKRTKNSLLFSAISLLLCISMLLGTTYAWFTDSVTSNGNRIVSGTLDVEMYWSESLDGPWHNVEEERYNTIFNYDKWEPGYTELRYIKIVNKGNLALKYQLSLSPAGTVGKLAEVIDVYFSDSPTVVNDRAALLSGTPVGTLNDIIAGISAGMFAPPEGMLLPAGTQVSSGTTDGTAVCSLALHMQENAGNEYQGETVGEGFFITLVATQASYESDSFGEDYDEDASFPALNLPVLASAAVTTDNSGVVTQETAINEGAEISAVVSAGTKLEAGTDSITLTVKLVSENGNINATDGTISRTLDVHVSGIADDNTQPVIVTIENALPINMNLGAINLYHTENGVRTEMTKKTSAAEVTAHNDFYYNSVDGSVIMALKSFSEILFEVDEANPWGGNVATDFAKGSGIESDPYMINTADQLAYLAQQVNDGISYSNTFFKLGKDIVLNTWDGVTDDQLSRYNDNTGAVEGNKNITAKGLSKYNDVAFEQQRAYTYKDETCGNAGEDYHYLTWTPIGNGSNEFSGTFDGNNHYVSGLFKLWYKDPMESSPMGLFGWVHDGTVKNLTVKDSFIYTYGGTVGLISAYASGNTSFENVQVKDNFVTSYNYPLGGILGMAWQANADGDSAKIDDEITFNNVTVDNTNLLEALWGTYDSSIGGIVGTAYPNTDIKFNNVTSWPEMSLYNDCCANYQWFAYRYSGMLIGYVRASDRAAWLAHNIHCSNVVVKYGEWTDQYYCERVELGKGSYNGEHEWKYQRISKDQVLRDNNGNVIGCDTEKTGHNHDAGKSYTYKGQSYTTVAEDEDHKAVNIEFNQLFGGGQGVYGETLEKYKEYCTAQGVSAPDVTVYDAEKGFGSISVKLPNTYKYLYRVGNRDDITIGTLFKAEEGTNVVSTGVTLKSVVITGVTGVDYTEDKNNWENGKIKFTGTGVVKLILEYRGVPVELNLEVIDAVNATSATDATSNNVCLLSDVQNAGSMTVSNEYAFYGNGFSLNYTGNGSQGDVKVSNYAAAYVTVDGGILDNVQVKCAQYSGSYGSVPGDNPSQSGSSYPNIMPAVTAKGNAVIQNCYIYGARANIFSSSGNIKIKDTVCECAATANIQLWSSSNYTVTLDNVTTIQYLYNANRVLGFGVLNGHNESPSNAKIEINNVLTQYNWVCNDDASNLTNSTAKRAIQEAVSKKAYQHSSNGTTYVNLGIAYLNDKNHEINDNRANSSEYSYSSLTIDVGSLVSLNGGVYSIKSGNGTVERKDGSDIYDQADNSPYTPQIRLKSDLGGQKIAYDADTDEYCYVENGTLKVMFINGDSKELDLAAMMSIEKYTGQDLSLTVSCVDEGGTPLTVTDGKVTLNEQKNYTITYSLTDRAIYDKNGSLTSDNITYTKQLPLSVLLKDDSIPNAEFEFDKTKMMFYYTGSATSEKQVLPLLNGLKIYDYDINNNRYLRFNGDAANAYLSIVKIEHSNADSYSTTKFTLKDGGVLEMKYYSHAESGSATYTSTIKKGNDNKLYACNDGTTNSAYAICWEISYYKFTGNNGTEIIQNGDTSISTNVTQAMKDSAVNKTSNGHTVERLDRSKVMAFNNDGTPVGLVFTGSTKIQTYKVDSSLNSKTAYIWKYGKFEEKTNTSMSNYSVSISKTISFDPNGGKCTQSVAYTTSSQTSVTLPTPTRSSQYEFLGWYTEASGGTKRGGAGDTYTPSGSETLYAQWKTLIKYTVTFNAGSEGSVSPSSVNNYSGTEIPLPTPTSATHWLIGWYNGNESVGGAGDSYTIPENNMTLTAHWSPKCTVTYNANGGTVSPASATYEGTALTLPTPTNGAKTFEGWFTAAEGGTLVGPDGDSYKPTANIELFAHWSNNIKVTFNGNGGTAGTDSETYYHVTPITLPSATWAGHQFNGWYTAASGGTKVGNAGESYVPTEPTTLYAQWTAYTVTYDANGGSVSPTSDNAGSDGTVTLPTPTRTGYKFAGWFTATSGGSSAGAAGENYEPNSDITLYAQWTVNSYKVTITTSNSSTAVTVNGTTVNNGGSVAYNSVVKVVLSYTQSNSLTFTIKQGSTNVTRYSDAACTKTTTSTDAGTYYFKMPAGDVTINSSSSSCVVEGTLITLADGTRKAVEDLTMDDMLLVWNLETGEYDIAPMVFIDSDPLAEYTVMHVCFSDGSDVGVVSEHGFFDLDLGKYVYISEKTMNDYDGHRFVKESDIVNNTWEVVTLTDVWTEQTTTTVYSPVTAVTLCYYTNGMLSMPGGIEGLFNIFDVDTDTMTYDAASKQSDIDTYGLLTIEDYGGMITEDMFYVFNGQYLGIAVGKGQLTWEYITYLAERYAPLCE